MSSVGTDTKELAPEKWADRYGDALFRYVVSRLRDAELAEELVQQTFLAALVNRSQFTGVGSEKGWLMSILKRKMIDHLRSRNRSQTLDSNHEAGDPLDQFFDRHGRWRQRVRATLLKPLDSVDRDEFWPIFQECLSGLPDKQAGAFLLREVDEMTTDAICKDLQVTASNLWVLLHRARLRLADCMKKRWLYEKE